MPAASRPGQQTTKARQGVHAGDAGPAGADPAGVLAAEQEHMRCSRRYLRLMREDVLSLRALGGDPVSEEYLKAALRMRV